MLGGLFGGEKKEEDSGRGSGFSLHPEKNQTPSQENQVGPTSVISSQDPQSSEGEASLNSTPTSIVEPTQSNSESHPTYDVSGNPDITHIPTGIVSETRSPSSTETPLSSETPQPTEEENDESASQIRDMYKRIERENQELNGKLVKRIKTESGLPEDDILLFVSSAENLNNPQTAVVHGLHPKFGPIFIRGPLAAKLAENIDVGDKLSDESEFQVVDEEPEKEQWLTAYREAKKTAEKAVEQRTRSRYVKEIFQAVMNPEPEVPPPPDVQSPPNAEGLS